MQDISLAGSQKFYVQDASVFPSGSRKSYFDAFRGQDKFLYIIQLVLFSFNTQRIYSKACFSWDSQVVLSSVL